jgi:hypothetical protein
MDKDTDADTDTDMDTDTPSGHIQKAKNVENFKNLKLKNLHSSLKLTLENKNCSANRRMNAQRTFHG